jgi:hypothetical protein
MNIFGFTLPLWIVFLGIIIFIIIAWKLIKFAIKLVIILVIFFAILFGLDYFNIFDLIQKIISGGT